MSTNPALSVIVISYNNEDYIVNCLESVRSQTFSDIEIICVDDASSDNSCNILKQFEQNDDRIRCIYHTKNMSASQSRKDAVLSSKGSYIMFVDGDDYLEPNACESAYQAIKDKNTDIVQFGAIVENWGRVPESRIKSNEKSLLPYKDLIEEDNLLHSCFADKKFSFTIWNKIFSGDIVREAFAFVEDGVFPKANDLYAMYYILKLARSYYGIEDKLYHYCFGRGMTGRNVMDLKNFSVNCQGYRVAKALKRHVEAISENEEEKEIVSIIEQNLLNEQLGKWYENLERSLKLDGIKYIADIWELSISEVCACLANKYWYSREKIAEYLTGLPELDFQRRNIKTIALFYHSIFNGGAQHVVAQLCNLFAAYKAENGLKYKVVLVTDEEPQEGEYELLDSVEREVIPNASLFPKEPFSIRQKEWERIITEHQVDVVLYSQWVSPVCLWDMLSIKTHKLHPAFIIHAHTFFGVLFKTQSNIVKETKRSFALIDGMVTLSRYDAYYWSGINKNVTMIENPCAISSKAGKANWTNRKEIIWVGRISSEKQPLEMIEIMKYVVMEEPDCVCRIIGDGSESILKKMQENIEKYGLEESVKLEGFQSDVTPYYQNAKILVMTSQFEGFPLTFIEGAANGLPIVMYDIPWLEAKRLFDGWISVSQLDSEAAASEIVSLLTDEGEWCRRSEKLYNGFLKYEKLDIIEKWDNYLSGLENEEPEANSKSLYESVKPEEIIEQIINFHGMLVQNYSQQVTKLKNSEKKKNDSIKKLKKERDKSKKKVKDMTKSNSWKIGRTVTFPVRVLKRIMKKI